MNKLAIILLFFTACLASHAEQKPNIVFLLVDDLGYGDFGCYGARFNETPHIDKLAAQGMRFTNAYSACTVCSPSRAAILSGCYPARLHLTDWIAGHVNPRAKLKVPDWKMKIDHERILMPEALKNEGYATGFYGKWHLMPEGQKDMNEHFPTNHGFDRNVGGREWGQPKGRGKYFSPFDMPGLDDGKPGDYLTNQITDAALNFIGENAKKKPFLLYFSYYTLHGPLMAPRALVKKYEQKAKGFQNTKNELLNPVRAGMVECLDNSVGRLVAKLEELGIADNTIIVLTGDNGGDYPETSGGLRDFKGWSHEGAVRAPFIAKWPTNIKENTTCDKMVIGMDLYPTFLALAGVSPLPEQHQDGDNIAPLLTGVGKAPERKSLFWHYPHYHRTKPYGAIREENWKLIEFFEDGKLELYDLNSDRLEKNDLSVAKSEKTAELLAKLKTWRTSVNAQMMTPNPNYDPTKGKKKAAGKKNGE